MVTVIVINITLSSIIRDNFAVVCLVTWTVLEKGIREKRKRSPEKAILVSKDQINKHIINNGKDLEAIEPNAKRNS